MMAVNKHEGSESMNIEKIISSLSKADDISVVVFGDYSLDKYLYIDPKRDELSVETGLIAWQVHKKSMAAGIGGTITNNLRAMKVPVTCIGVVGDDGEGFELLRELKRVGADTTYMVKDAGVCTSTYIKPMRKDEAGVYHEMNRLDFRNYEQPPRTTQNKMLENLEKTLVYADAVIVTDQFFQRNQGAVTDYIRECLGELALKYSNKIFYADSRSFVNEYKNMIVKCNNLELFSKFGGNETDAENLDAIIAKGQEIAKHNGQLFFVTRGSKGIVVFGEKVDLIPAFKVTGEIDIVGAGDATNAGIVMGLALGLTPSEAALLGCCISSITIQQIGKTGTASPEAVVGRLTELRQTGEDEYELQRAD